MSENESYNGWANRETWAVALHINNDQGWQESVHESLRDATFESVLYPDSAGVSLSVAAQAEDVKNLARSQAGEIIRGNVEDTLELLLQDVFEHGRTEPDTFLAIRDDLGSLWRVDWTGLGAAFLADLDES